MHLEVYASSCVKVGVGLFEGGSNDLEGPGFNSLLDHRDEGGVPDSVY